MRTRWGLLAILLLAALNFLWQLGSSSYFVDEVLSIEHSLPSTAGIVHAVNQTENTPWTFFLLLHDWLELTGSQGEFITRLPSAIAGVALVGAMFWTAGAFLGRAGSLVAAALCAASPLVLQYAQQVRVYVFALLALTIAIGAAVRAEQRAQRRGALLAVGALAAVASLWLHYATVLLIASLCVWVATRRALSKQARIGFVCACAIAQAAALPVLIQQYRLAPNGGLVGIAGLNWTNAWFVAGTPFAGRFLQSVGVLQVIGAVVTVTSVVTLFVARGREVRQPRLLAALGVVPIGVILLLGVVGKDVVTPRYTVLATPPLVIVIAAAIMTLGRPRACVLAVAAALAAGWGLILSHSRPGYYADARATIAYIHAHQRQGDAVVVPGLLGNRFPYIYYAGRRLRPVPQFVSAFDRTGLTNLLLRRERIWFIRQWGPSFRGTRIRSLKRLLAPFRYHLLGVHKWTTSQVTVLYLTVPDGPRPPRRGGR